MTVLAPVPAVFETDFWSRRRGAHARPGRFDRIRPDLFLGVVLCGVAAYRVLVIGLHGEPSGIDFGNWLMLGHQLFGRPLAGAASIAYPPVVPALTVVFTWLFGVVWADAVLLGVAGVAPAVGLYVAGRLSGLRWVGVPAAVLLASTSSTGEAVAWGGAPQLIGLGMAAATLGVAVVVMRTRSISGAFVLGVMLLAVGGTSHLVLAQLALTLVVLAMLHAGQHRADFGRGTWLGRRGWFALGGLALAPMLVLVPLYLQLLATVGQSLGTTSQIPRGWPSLQAFISNLWVVYRDTPWVWRPALVLTAATPLLLGRKQHRSPVWSVTTALVLGLGLQASVAAEDRLVYLAPVAVGFALTLWLGELAAGRIHLPGGTRVLGALVAALVVATGVASWRGLRYFPAQRDYYGSFVPGGSVAALDWIRLHTPADAVMLVAPVDGLPFGWWVQGYGERAAVVASEPRFLNFTTERTRALSAVALLSTPEPLGDSVMAGARAQHVSYLVIPWAWGGLSHEALNVFRSNHPSDVAFDNEALVIVKVPS